MQVLGTIKSNRMEFHQVVRMESMNYIKNITFTHDHTLLTTLPVQHTFDQFYLDQAK